MELSNKKLLKIAEKYGDAFYLLDSEKFEKNYFDLKKEFSIIYPNFNIAYSYKTNYIPKFCKIVNKNGGYAEVVSDMELEIAIRIGVRPEKIIWNGPIKNEEVVEKFLLEGGTINVDSTDELDTIKLIALKHPKNKINIGIRCNFDVGDGVISRFGFDTESKEFIEILEYIKATPNINLINLQCHFADRNAKYWNARAKEMINIVKKVEGILGYIPERVDLGGGISGNMPEFLKRQFTSTISTYRDYAVAAATLFKESFPNADIELLIEPGTALAGDSMKFVGRVKSIKTVRGKTFITVLGSQKNINMGNINPPIEIYKINKGKEYKNADIVGYTCIESDIMYKNYNGEIAVGDFIVYSNCGSYSIVMKPPFILPNFPVLDICNKEIEIIKNKESFDDLFQTYNF